MVRRKKYDPTTDVLTAARRRMEDIYLQADRVVVAFSGGKDSLVCLHLLHEVHEQYGDPRPVLAVFRDHEFMEKSVRDTVERVAAYDWADVRWWCLQRRLQASILNTAREFITWDRERTPHQHEPPDWADRFDLTEGVWSVEKIDQRMMDLAPGRVITVTGLRAAESVTRLRSVYSKLTEPHIVNGKPVGVTVGRPIYDWLENDVLRYLYDIGETPSAAYDGQAWANVGAGRLRTSALTSSESIRESALLAVVDPEAYDSVVSMWPEVGVSRRYAKDTRSPIDTLIGAQRAHTYDDLLDWVYRTFSGYSLQVALHRLDTAISGSTANPHGYPVWHVQREIARDGHQSGVNPLTRRDSRFGKHPTLVETMGSAALTRRKATIQ